ncbi:ribosome biogenesis protein Alb1 [Aspergillus aurantiobrunneus]
MAKARPLSKHSRAARRAASPSLDLDKSLTSLPRAEDTVMQRESVLADRAKAGVSKKQTKPKAKSRAQRLRQQKGMDRAEAVLDQLEIKVAKSNNRAKTVKSRRVCVRHSA